MQYSSDQVRTALVKKIHKIVSECTRCSYHKNGRALPFFGSRARYLMIGEAPHVDEISQGTPFVGDCGSKMWKVIKEQIGLVREDFIIFNSVLCKPDIPFGKTIGKPTKVTIGECFIKRTDLLVYLHSYFNIRNILVLGNYARYIFTGKIGGIDSVSGSTTDFEYCGKKFILTYCLHPAAFGYNPANRDKFEASIRAFGEAIAMSDAIRLETQT